MARIKKKSKTSYSDTKQLIVPYLFHLIAGFLIILAVKLYRILRSYTILIPELIELFYRKTSSGARTFFFVF